MNRWDFHECLNDYFWLPHYVVFAPTMEEAIEQFTKVRGGAIDDEGWGLPWVKVSDKLYYRVWPFSGVDPNPEFAMNLDGSLYNE